jgi:two-component system response regulator HydG
MPRYMANMSHTILVVDDDESNRITLKRLLEREGYVVNLASNGKEALDSLRSSTADLLLTDLKMPGMDGDELLRAALVVDQHLQVMIMTAFGTVDRAVEALKQGACDFITKPLKRAELLAIITKALHKRDLTLENQRLRETLAKVNTDALHSGSTSMVTLIKEVEAVADSEASLLITGSSGTGKGRLARHIHKLSSRRDGELVTVNCGALPDQLLESELFGHEKGAFTGAVNKKLGRVDIAKGGTLFLDEVTEMTLATQVKLLRVLQDGEYERVGGTKTLHANIRVLAASNRDIQAAIAAGSFRRDLYYRLNVVQLRLPSLRERQEDILPLAQQFLHTYVAKSGRDIHGFTESARLALQTWTWPGNIRELENAIERASLLCRSSEIDLCDLPGEVRGDITKRHLQFTVPTPLKEVERQMIQETLIITHGDKSLTANLLGITARTIYRREADWSEEE